jgi:hypothetical protein
VWTSFPVFTEPILRVGLVLQSIVFLGSTGHVRVRHKTKQSVRLRVRILVWHRESIWNLFTIAQWTFETQNVVISCGQQGYERSAILARAQWKLVYSHIQYSMPMQVEGRGDSLFNSKYMHCSAVDYSDMNFIPVLPICFQIADQKTKRRSKLYRALTGWETDRIFWKPPRLTL